MKSIVVFLTALFFFSLAGMAYPAPAGINLTGPWKFNVDPLDVGVQNGWHSPKFDDSSWKSIQAPGEWENQGITQVNPRWQQVDDLEQPYTGYAWYRKNVMIPAEWKGRNLTLEMGRIDDLDWTYFNGKLVGETSRRDQLSSSIFRTYRIPDSAIKYGQSNVIAVRVLDLRGIGGFIEGPLRIETAGTSDMNGRGSGSVGQSVTVEKGQTVPELSVVMGDAIVYGHVTGDVAIVGGDLLLKKGGRIDGDVAIVGGKLIREPETVIKGDSVSVAPYFPPDALRWFAKDHGSSIQFDALVFTGLAVLGALTAALVVALFPARMDCIARTSISKPGWSLVCGILGVLATAPVMILLFVTCVGILLIPVVIGLVFLFWLMGGVGVELASGRRIGEIVKRPFQSAIQAAVVGSLLLSLVSLIPYAGDVIFIALTTLGFGALILTGFGTAPDWFERRMGKAPQPPVSTGGSE